MSGMTLRNKKAKETFSSALASGDTRGKKGKGATLKIVDDDDSSQASQVSTPATDVDKSSHIFEKQRQERLTKQELIKNAWEKRNKLIFRSLGKMTHAANEAALKNIKWDAKFQCTGKSTEVSIQNVFAHPFSPKLLFFPPKKLIFVLLLLLHCTIYRRFV